MTLFEMFMVETTIGIVVILGLLVWYYINEVK